MDLTSLMTALLSDNTLGQVSKKSGVDASDVVSVVAAALPALLQGANAQAQNAETAESFHEAVTEHAKKDPKKVDEKEGEKIVNHLLGAKAEETEKALAKKTGLSKAQIALILAALAPVVMNMLGSETTSQNSNNSSATANILSSLLGGSSSSATNAVLGSVLGSVLSSAVGSNNNSSILGSVLSAATGSNNNTTNSLLGSLVGSALGGSNNNNSGLDLGGILTSLLK